MTLIEQFESIDLTGGSPAAHNLAEMVREICVRVDRLEAERTERAKFVIGERKPLLPGDIPDSD